MQDINLIRDKVLNIFWTIRKCIWNAFVVKHELQTGTMVRFLTHRVRGLPLPTASPCIVRYLYSMCDGLTDIK